MMKQSQRGFITYIAVIIFGVVLAGAGLYYYTKNDSQVLTKQKEAKIKVETEVAKLENLKTRYVTEGVTITKITSGYSNVRENILAQTDVFFDQPESVNPKIKIKITDKSIEVDINNRRLQITNLLEAWERKNKIINSGSLYQNLLPTLPDLVKSAKEDMAYIQKYVNELKTIIDNLSPANSNLTQTQINSYKSIVETTAEQIQELVTVINNLPAEAILPPAQTSTTVSDPAPTPVVPPIVTLIQIQDQEEIVAQIEQAVVDPPIIESNPTSTAGQYVSPADIDNSNQPGIIPQYNQGPPTLIEGSNKF